MGGEDGIEEGGGWDEDFVISGSDDDEDEPLQVIGVRADPTNGETWDSDFDFSDDEGAPPPPLCPLLPCSLPLAHSAPQFNSSLAPSISLSTFSFFLTIL
jgi:hypothetical protein